jgi:DNA-binding transcriptional MerR regulator/quercetin dioxygenase-like cupin family protein
MTAVVAGSHARPTGRAAGAAVDGAAAAGRYRIGEVARRVGVSPSALRLWERQGLVRPFRTAARYRLYSEADVAHLARVARMRNERVSAPGIRRLLRRSAPMSSPVAGALRALRRERGLSLREASQRSGLSVSFLSALERGTTGASVATVQRLTSAYGSTLLDLFGPAARTDRRVVRRRKRPVLEVGHGVRIEQLARGAVHLEPQLFVLAPGASSEEAYAHDGEEFLYVVAGAVSLWIGEAEHYRLDEGDAVSFPSSLPHRWRNAAGGETRLLWINTPPTF